MQWSTDIRQIKAAIWNQAFVGRTSVSCPIGRVVGIRRRKGQHQAMIFGWGRWYPVEDVLIVAGAPPILAQPVVRLALDSHRWERGEREVAQPLTNKGTVAEGIAIAAPARSRQILAAVRETQGTIMTVTEADIAEARSKLARQGLYVEPTAAVATAGLSTYLRQAEQAPLLVTREALRQETHIAVVALTGSGLKAASSSGAGELFLQIGQFLRVQQSIDLLNAHGTQGQADDHGQPALFPEQDGRAAIDLGQGLGQRPLIFAHHAQPETRHGELSVDWLEIRLHFAATIRPGDGILSQEAGQSRHVPGLTGGKKTEQQLALALRLRVETRALVLQSLPGSMKDLAAIGRAFREHHPDFAKRVIKHFIQEKNGALRRAESL